MAGDTVSLLDFLRDRFGGKTYVAGFSFGATLGAHAAAQRPDLVATLVAVGMDVDGAAAASGAYDFALAAARQRGNRRATRQLEAIGPPPHLSSKQFTTRVRWATNFGGVTTSETYATLARGLVASLVRSPDYSAADIIRTVRGISATQAALLPELATMDLARTVPRLDVPVVMVQGRHDQVAPGAAAQRYAGSLQAPGKRLVWFENSAHTPHLEEPGKFRDLLIGIRAASDATGRHRRQRAARTGAAMSGAQSWMLYGAAGHTGALIAQHARKRGHQPMLAGRNAAAVAALAERLDLPHRAVTLDDPAALSAALDDVELVLNAAGPFVRTAAPLAEACLAAGVHYIDIGNELQVFRTLYDLDQRAQRAGVTIMPGAGFGVVATNCLARYVSDAVGGAQHLEVAARGAAARQGPGIAASVRENLPYGGWTRQAGRLHPCPLGSGITAIPLPDGPCRVMPFPTGDLEAAFQATGAPDVTAYSPVPADPAALDPQAPDPEAAGPPIYRSFGWARATGPDGGHAQAWLQTGESYAFTAAASIRAVEETLTRSLRGAFSPAAAFGADFALTIPDTTRIDAIPAEAPPAQTL